MSGRRATASGSARRSQLAGLAEVDLARRIRLVKGGAVHLDGEVAKDEQLKLERGKRYLVRVGSKNRRFAHLVVG